MLIFVEEKNGSFNKIIHQLTQKSAGEQPDVELITVTAPPATIIVYVVDVEGPITKNTGDSVAVTWDTSPSATSCTCQCQNESGVAIDCGGSSIQNPKSNCGDSDSTKNIGDLVESKPPTITNILQPTTFKVSCLP